MESCDRCEDLPDQLGDFGRLFFVAPLQHTLGKIKRIFENNSYPCKSRGENILFTKLTSEGLSKLTEKMKRELSQQEMNDVKALWLEESREIILEDMTQLEPLEELIGLVEADWLIDILREDRLFNVYQPIVQADNSDRIHGFECLLRARDQKGNSIGPGPIFESAEKSNLLFYLDREARIKAVENTKITGNNQRFFINFIPTSIYDPDYCLKTTMQAVNRSEIDKEQLVFEVVESEKIKDRDNLIGILEQYKNEGVNVALDDLGAGYSSLNLLTDLKPDYVKFDRELVSNIHDNSLQSELAKSLIETSKKNDIRTIAEGIETAEERDWFREHGVDFMQGFYFSRPQEQIQFRQKV